MREPEKANKRRFEGLRQIRGAQGGHRGRSSFIAFLVVAALFRASENAFQTSYAPFGHVVLGLSPAQIGVMVTLSGGVGVITNLLLVSRIKTRRLLGLAGVALVSISVALGIMFVARSPLLYLVAAFVFGVASGMAMPVLSSMVAKIRGVSAERDLAAFTVVISGSLAIGPLIESTVLHADGNALPFALASFIPLPLLGIAVLALFVKVRNDVGIQVESLALPARLLENDSLRLAIVSQLINQVPFITLVTFGALIGSSMYHVSTATSQLSFTLFFGTAFLTRVVLVSRPAGTKTLSLIRLAGVLMFFGITLLAIGSGRGDVYFLMAMAFLGVPHGLLFPLSLSIIARGTSYDSMPKANAALFTTIGLVSVVFPIIAGLVAAHFGYPAVLAIVLFCVAVLQAMQFRIIGALSHK